MSGKQWRIVEDNQVRLIFGKRCACADVPDEIAIYPTGLRGSGTPVCEECGEDYEYEQTEVLL